MNDDNEIALWHKLEMIDKYVKYQLTLDESVRDNKSDILTNIQDIVRGKARVVELTTFKVESIPNKV